MGRPANSRQPPKNLVLSNLLFTLSRALCEKKQRAFFFIFFTSPQQFFSFQYKTNLLRYLIFISWWEIMKKYLSRKAGASNVEYGVMVGLIAVALLFSVQSVGKNLSELFTTTESVLANGVTAPNAPIPPTEEETPITLSSQNGAIQWTDGTSASSCLEYLSPTAPYTYEGATGTGLYWIDPDGTGSQSPVQLTCDMTYDGGGWIVIDHDREGESGIGNSCSYSSCLVFSVTYGVSDEIVEMLANAATDIEQDFTKNCKSSYLTYAIPQDDFTQKNYISKVGSSDKVGLDATTHFDDVTIPCDQNNSVAYTFSYRFVNKTDITPIKSLWGGDSDDTPEVSSYLIGKLYLR